MDTYLDEKEQIKPKEFNDELIKLLRQIEINTRK